MDRHLRHQHPGGAAVRPLLNNEDFIVGAGGGGTRIDIRATLELLLIIANIGTAVVPFALFRRYNERLAIGFVTARIVERTFIAVGIVSVLAIMTLRDDPGGTTDATLVSLGQSLVVVHDATFLLGPGFVVGVRNGADPRLPDVPVRSDATPPCAVPGSSAGPLVSLSGIAVMFGAFDAGSGRRPSPRSRDHLGDIPRPLPDVAGFQRLPRLFLGEEHGTEIDPGLDIAAP